MKKAIVITMASVATAAGATGVGIALRKSAMKKLMNENMHEVKAYLSEIKANRNVDLEMVHRFEEALWYQVEHDIPLKESDAIGLVNELASTCMDVLHRLGMIMGEDEESDAENKRLADDLMLSEIYKVERAKQRVAESKAAFASAVSSAIEFTGNVATATVAAAAMTEEHRKEQEKINNSNTETVRIEINK